MYDLGFTSWIDLQEGLGKADFFLWTPLEFVGGKLVTRFLDQINLLLGKSAPEIMIAVIVRIDISLSPLCN